MIGMELKLFKKSILQLTKHILQRIYITAKYRIIKTIRRLNDMICRTLIINH